MPAPSIRASSHASSSRRQSYRLEPRSIGERGRVTPVPCPPEFAQALQIREQPFSVDDTLTNFVASAIDVVKCSSRPQDDSSGESLGQFSNALRLSGATLEGGPAPSGAGCSRRPALRICLSEGTSERQHEQELTVGEAYNANYKL